MIVDKYRYPVFDARLEIAYRRLQERLGTLDDSYKNCPTRSFGSEARMAKFLQTSHQATPDLRSHEHVAFVRRPLDRFERRAPFEPIVYKFWKDFDCWQIDDEWIIKISSLFRREGATLRRHEIIKPRMGNVAGWAYVSPRDAWHWKDEIARIRDRSEMAPLLEAVAIYATFLVFHPLDDGNGRVARTLFHGNLRNRLRFSSPFLPLGPLIYRYEGYFTPAFRGMARSGNWTQFFELMHDLLEITCGLHDNIIQFKKALNHAR